MVFALLVCNAPWCFYFFFGNSAFLVLQNMHWLFLHCTKHAFSPTAGFPEIPSHVRPCVGGAACCRDRFKRRHHDSRKVSSQSATSYSGSSRSRIHQQGNLLKVNHVFLFWLKHLYSVWSIGCASEFKWCLSFRMGK